MQRTLKSAMIVLSILMMHAVGFAQPVEALVPSSDNWSFFFQPELKTTVISDKSAQLVGVRLGPALDRTLYLGLAGYTLISSVNPDRDIYQNLGAFDLWYAGLAAEYTILSHKIVHAGIGCFVGGGQLHATARNSGSENAGLFIAEPQLNVMINLTSTLELGLGLSYRFVNGSDLRNLADEDLRGPAGSVFLRWTEGP